MGWGYCGTKITDADPRTFQIMFILIWNNSNMKPKYYYNNNNKITLTFLETIKMVKQIIIITAFFIFELIH